MDSFSFHFNNATVTMIDEYRCESTFFFPKPGWKTNCHSGFLLFTVLDTFSFGCQAIRAVESREGRSCSPPFARHANEGEECEAAAASSKASVFRC
jgi:hypothetical protein